MARDARASRGYRARARQVGLVVLMMGDNRRNSSDSRKWGTVRRDLIWAKIIGH